MNIEQINKDKYLKILKLLKAKHLVLQEFRFALPGSVLSEIEEEITDLEQLIKDIDSFNKIVSKSNFLQKDMDKVSSLLKRLSS